MNATIQIAINGSRKEQVVPKKPELVQSAILAVEKGATSIHFHPRDPEGNETLKGEYVDLQVSVFKANLKNIPLGISTGAWIEPDLEERLRQISSWTILPDFVSINFYESGYYEVADLICTKGIKIEAGLSDLKSTQNFIKNAARWNILRILIEPQEQDLQCAGKTIDQIEALLDDAKNKTPILLHGFDATCWELLEKALQRNWQTRIGFEDTLVLPDGKIAQSNGELMEHAFKIRARLSNV